MLQNPLLKAVLPCEPFCCTKPRRSFVWPSWPQSLSRTCLWSFPRLILVGLSWRCWRCCTRGKRERRVLRAGPTELAREGTRQGRFEIGLLQAWHKCASPRPEVKEIKECLAFHRSTRRLLGDNELLVDAAGGHGGIALAFLASGRIKQAIVADIYQPRGYSNLRAAWAPDAKIEHRHVDLRTAGWLRNLMAEAGVEAAQTVVTACHACGVLADELIHECLQAEVSFAVVPCCHGEKAGILILPVIGFVHTAPSSVRAGSAWRNAAKAGQGLPEPGVSYSRRLTCCSLLEPGGISAGPWTYLRHAALGRDRCSAGLHRQPLICRREQ